MKFPTLKSLAINYLTGRSLLSSDIGYDNNFLTGGTLSSSSTGISVNEDSALTVVAYYACVRLISETFASLPAITYHKLPRGKERATDHSLYKILHDTPNPEMNSFTFRETEMSHLLRWGNAYSEIQYESDNLTVKALWPLMPDRTYPFRDQKTNQIYYKSAYSGGQFILPAYRVLHIPGLGFDGLIGYSTLGLIRESLGLSLATEKMGAKLFGNGLTIGGVLEHPGKMSKDAQDRFRKAVEDRHQGLDMAHRLLILEEGMKYEKNNIPPEDAQFLETRQFQKTDIASFFHVPPHMIGDLDRATYSNIEQQSLEFVVYTMRPWLVRWEQAINQKLFLPTERDSHFVEFLVDGLLRGDIMSRYQAYSIGRNWGWLSANDVRELENQNPIDDGDVYMAPANMIPASEFEAQRPVQAQQVPPPKG